MERRYYGGISLRTGRGNGANPGPPILHSAFFLLHSWAPRLTKAAVASSLIGLSLLPGQLLQELADLGHGGLDTLQRAAREALDNERPVGEADLLQTRQDCREIHLAAPDVHEHFLGRKEILP